jgi:hypothetical protein
VYDGTEIISDPQKVADMLNNYFVAIIDDLLSKNNKNNTNTQLQKKKGKLLSKYHIYSSSY